MRLHLEARRPVAVGDAHVITGDAIIRALLGR
jgi:hypothetical protein